MSYKKDNFFGEFWDDDVKSDTICFRVSKKTKKYFVEHANGKFGSSQKAMEKIFKDYMESIVYKKGKVNSVTSLLIPKFNSKDDLKKIDESKIKIKDTNLVKISGNDAKLKDNINRDVIVKSFDYNESDEYIILPFYFNNYLDIFKNGVYSNGNDNQHSGLIMSVYNNVDFYILFKFSNIDKLDSVSLISKNKAYKLAISVNNDDLAKIIIGFNQNNGNLDDINLLKLRKIQLENELSLINEKLNKY